MRPVVHRWPTGNENPKERRLSLSERIRAVLIDESAHGEQITQHPECDAEERGHQPAVNVKYFTYC